MAVHWLTSLRNIPWTQVLQVAPSLVEGSRKLWGRLANREAGVSTGPGSPGVAESSPTEQIAALEIRLHAMQKELQQIGGEMVSSFDVVKSLSEQHSEMVKAMDVLISRTRVLLWVCAVLAAAVAALAVLVLSR